MVAPALLTRPLTGPSFCCATAKRRCTSSLEVTSALHRLGSGALVCGHLDDPLRAFLIPAEVDDYVVLSCKSQGRRGRVMDV
jgi:hypothetical protein